MSTEASQDSKTTTFELLSFLQQYVDLSIGHINQIRDKMDSTVSSVMETVMEMENAKTARKNIAETALVMRENQHLDESGAQGGDSSFKSVDISKLESVEGSDTNSKNLKQALGINAVYAGQKFKKHMENLGIMDETLQNLLVKMMGTLSKEDVLGQRLDHVAEAFDIFKTSIGEVLEQADEFTVQKVNAITKKISEKTYKTYTMEEEKECFKAILGKLQ